MFSLTDEQIAFIENDIKVRGINSPDLHIDLLDHICCLIETELDEYRNFETVYEQTLTLFGDKGLIEIQNETNRLLTFKHYYLMNGTMKISGYVSGILILLGAFFKMNHWPGAGPLLVFGVFIFSTLFLPLMFILKYKSDAESNKSVMLSSIAAVAAVCICIGLLFKIMHWPMASEIIITGAILLVLGYLPIYVFSVYKNTTNKINATSTIILIMAGVGLLVVGGKNDMSRGVYEGLSNINDNTHNSLLFIETHNEKNYQLKLNQEFVDATKLKQIKTLEQETNLLIAHIKNLQTYLLMNVGHLPEAEAKSTQTKTLQQLNNNENANAILFGTDLNFTAATLKNKVNAYKQTVNKIIPSISFVNLNTENKGKGSSWESIAFESTPLAMIIHRLTQLQLDVKTIESTVLSQL